MRLDDDDDVLAGQDEDATLVSVPLHSSPPTEEQLSWRYLGSRCGAASTRPMSFRPLVAPGVEVRAPVVVCCAVDRHLDGVVTMGWSVADGMGHPRTPRHGCNKHPCPGVRLEGLRERQVLRAVRQVASLQRPPGHGYLEIGRLTGERTNLALV